MSKARDSVEDLRTIDADLALKATAASPVFTGNVGIGSSSPDGVLDVEGTIALGGNKAGVIFNSTVTPANNNTGSIGLVSGTINAPASANANSKISGLRVAPTTSGSFNGAAEIAGLKVETFNGQSASIATGLSIDAPTGGDVNYAAILNGGNVGIGVSSPAQKLTLDSGYVQVGNGIGGGGGVKYPYSSSNADTRNWRTRSDIAAYGDWGIEQSTTQSGETYATKLLINPAGYVTTPLQPSFRVGSVTTYSSSSTVLHTIDFHDIGNNYNPTNGRFTAPVAGVYYFGAQAISSSDTTSATQKIKFTKNGTDVCDARAGGYTQSSLHLKTVIQLAVGDYMDVVVEDGSVLGASGGYHDQFMGYLIG